VRVDAEVVDDLVRGDPVCDSALDAPARQFGGDDVGETCAELGEEVQDRDGEWGVGVGVDAVVGFDDYEAAVFGGVLGLDGGGGGGGDGVGETCGCGAETGGV